MRNFSKKGLALRALLFVVFAASVACSPEYTRQRGGGPGADVGNRTLGPSLQIHGPVNPDFAEPMQGKAVQTGK